MKKLFNKTTFTILCSVLVISAAAVSHISDILAFVHATTNAPTVQITSTSANSATMTVTFQTPVIDGDIADFELYDSNNQRVWQRFSNIGQTTYTMNLTNMPNGNFTVSVGLFKPNWSSNYAWYANVATLTFPSGGVQTSITPSVSPSITATTSVSLTPTVSQMQTQAGNQASPVSVAMSAYNNWKAKYVVNSGSSLRVARPENNNDTVSEGIGYGMLLSVFANDQQAFDGLLSYEQQHKDAKGLMNWDIDASGNVIGQGSATDADEDMVYALIKANQKWPGKGYDANARTMIAAMKSNEAEGDNLLNPGDNWGQTATMNPSYFAPNYYKAFAQISGDTQWNTIADTSSNWLKNAANSSTGLLPDWLNADYSQSNYGSDNHQHDFYYDASRTPIRALMNYQATGDGNAKEILQKQAAFFSSIGAGKLLSGYTLSGSPLTSYLDTTFLSAYAAAAAVDPFSSFGQQMIASLQNTAPSSYYGTSLRVLVLFILSGSN